MVTIFRSWIDTLSFLSPRNIFALAKDAFTTLVKALWITVGHLYWLVIIDALWFLCFGTMVIKAFHVQKDTPLTLGGGALVLILVSAVIWSVLSIILFLLLRKPAAVIDIKRYIAEFFLRYIQFSFFLMVIALLGVLVVLSIGITHFPGMHWSFKVGFKIFQLLAIFYWFDSAFRLKDIAGSIEKTINLIVYKLPLLIAFILILIGFDALVSFVFQNILSSSGLQHMFFTDVHIEQLLALPEHKLCSVYALGLRYIKALLEFFLIALLYIFYVSQKDLVSAKSFFDEPLLKNNTDDDGE